MNKQSLIEKAVIGLNGELPEGASALLTTGPNWCGPTDAIGSVLPATECSGHFGYRWIERVESYPAIGDKYWILLCDREEFNATADRMRGKPDWKDAPEWANWLAQDSNGSWWFYEVKVTHNGVSFVNPACRGNEKAAVGKVIGDWRKTLEQRPEQKPEPTAKNWFDAGELPPVGTVCEYSIDGGSWKSCEIRYVVMNQGVVIYSNDSAGDNFYENHKIRFRSTNPDRQQLIDIIELVGNQSNGVLADAIMAAGWQWNGK